MDMRKRDLSGPGQRLVELMQSIQFGKLEGLVIVDGEPQWHPGPRVQRNILLGTKRALQKHVPPDDFVLKSAVVELFDYMDLVRNRTIDVLEIQHGLPFRLLLTEDTVPKYQ